GERIIRPFDDDCPADGAARSQFDFNPIHGAVGDFTERRITEILTRSAEFRIDIILAGQEALKLEFPLRIRPRLLSWWGPKNASILTVPGVRALNPLDGIASLGVYDPPFELVSLHRLCHENVNARCFRAFTDLYNAGSGRIAHAGMIGVRIIDVLRRLRSNSH